MQLLLLNTPQGLQPCYDEDYDEKRKLRIGQIYEAEIWVPRNPKFHRLYFALINCAWEYLPEETAKGFRTKENFRKYLEVAAGFCEPFYSPETNQWMEVPKSIAYDKMDNAEFQELYDRVKDVIFMIIGDRVSEEEFERNLSNF